MRALGSSWALVPVICFVSFCVLPAAYAIAAEGSSFLALFYDGRASHLFLNAAATGLIMLWSLRLTGRFDRKLAAVLGHVLVVHGALAFWILVARQFHSNRVMLTAVVVSVGLGALVMLARHVTSQPRIALLGRWHTLAEKIRPQVEHVQDPMTPLSEYDILLSSDVLDLSPEWSGPVARAMLRGKQVRHVAEFVEESQGVVSIDHFNLEDISSPRLNAYRFRQRILDVGLTLACSLVALPILAAGALIVMTTMGRPIMFSQPRVGLGGRSFIMYKLRTMRQATAADSISATSKGDLRVTAAGRLLRRFRVDELPQLFNVLKGDMSIVGPRPEQPALARVYAEKIPAFVYRELVRPGITGWAQVRAGYAADLEETRVKLTYDLFYIKNFSFALDVQILVRTIWTLIGGSGVR